MLITKKKVYDTFEYNSCRAFLNITFEMILQNVFCEEYSHLVTVLAPGPGVWACGEEAHGTLRDPGNIYMRLLGLAGIPPQLAMVILCLYLAFVNH